MPQSGSPTTKLSIVITNGDPLRAEVVLPHDWRGYTFLLEVDADGVPDFRARRDDPSVPSLNARRLQQVPLGFIRRAVIAEAKRTATPLRLFKPSEWPKPEDWLARKPGDVKLAELARDYERTLGVESVEAQKVTLAGDDYSANSIGRLISRARQRGLLTATSRGKAGGVLTPRARVLLGEITEADFRANIRTLGGWALIVNKIADDVNDRPIQTTISLIEEHAPESSTLGALRESLEESGPEMSPELLDRTRGLGRTLTWELWEPLEDHRAGRISMGTLFRVLTDAAVQMPNVNTYYECDPDGTHEPTSIQVDVDPALIAQAFVRTQIVIDTEEKDR